MLNFSNSIKILLFASIFLLSGSMCLARSKVDLEIKAQSPAETVRGGEKFTYTFTIKNLSAETAKDVILLHDLENELTFVSGGVSQGDYEFDKNQYPRRVRCYFGDIQGYAEVSVTIEAKVNDWGNEDSFSPTAELINKNVMSNFTSTLFEQPNSKTENTKDKTAETGRTLYIYYPDVVCDNCAEREVNIQPKIILKLLPSKNLPPRIEIVSPKNEAVFVKPFNKQIEVPIVIKASDADGKIVKVLVSDWNNPETRIVLEGNEYKYSIGGKTYTKKELEAAYEDEEFIKSLEVKANLTGKDTYTYVAKKFFYGRNRINISALDDGGRSSSQSVEFVINRDAAVEIISPKSGQIFTPDSTITIETISKINDSTTSQLRINGTVNDYFYPDTASIPLLQSVSKAGNTYRHQYVWKNAREGVYSLSVMLFDGELPSLYAETVRVIVAEPRVIKITSLKNGQEFKAGENIEITVEERDTKGQIVYDKLEIIIDGKTLSASVNNSLCEGCFPKSYVWQSSDIEKGTHTIQIIARQDSYSTEDAPILGKSEIVTIKVK